MPARARGGRGSGRGRGGDSSLAPTPERFEGTFRSGGSDSSPAAKAGPSGPGTAGRVVRTVGPLGIPAVGDLKCRSEQTPFPAPDAGNRI
jgi:hypothetical protein